MKIISSLKCALRSGESFESYYSRLSSDALQQRKKSLIMEYLLPSFLWLISLIIMGFGFGMKPELLILYSGTILILQVTLFLDYRKRKKIIDSELKKRK